MKTAAKLKELGFTEISTVECLLREMQVRKINQTVFDPLRQPTPALDRRDVAVADDANDDNDDAGAGKKRKIDEASPLGDEQEPPQKAEENQKSFVAAIPLLKMPGHTGFLTFATLPPCPKD